MVKWYFENLVHHPVICRWLHPIYCCLSVKIIITVFNRSEAWLALYSSSIFIVHGVQNRGLLRIEAFLFSCPSKRVTLYTGQGFCSVKYGTLNWKIQSRSMAVLKNKQTKVVR